MRQDYTSLITIFPPHPRCNLPGDAFLARCKAKGVPFVDKKGQGLSLQRAQAATVENVKEYMAKREERTRTFSMKWAKLLEKAEGLVLKHAPTSAAELGALLKVGDLKAFIVSRTGRTGAAKNNKTGEITTEAWAVRGQAKVPLAVPSACARQ